MLLFFPKQDKLWCSLTISDKAFCHRYFCNTCVGL